MFFVTPKLEPLRIGSVMNHSATVAWSLVCPSVMSHSNGHSAVGEIHQKKAHNFQQFHQGLVGGFNPFEKY